MSIENIKIPFSYFGGKRKVASTIWKGLGNVSNYVEPFAGSLSVLLSNPNVPKIETVNDLDCGLINFWRSVANDPETVIKYADFPVSETELHARHQWLVSMITDEFKTKMNNDPDYFDAKMGGYYVWGISASVGSNWLQPKGLKALPLLSSAGGGIHGINYDIRDQFNKLYQRLRRVRVACGDWKRIISPSITYNNKGLNSKDITGMLLDPPYLSDKRDKVYIEEGDMYKDVCQWAIENGDNKKLRIAVCGYDGDYDFPTTWKKYNWQSSGMGNMSDDRGRANSKRETVYFSPNCLEI